MVLIFMGNLSNPVTVVVVLGDTVISPRNQSSTAPLTVVEVQRQLGFVFTPNWPDFIV